MNHARRNHLICELMAKDKALSAKDAQRMTWKIIQRGKQKRLARDDRRHVRGSKPKKRKTYESKDFGQLLRDAGYTEYDDYLKSEHWIAFRVGILVERHVCAACGSDQHPRIHHIDYSRLGRESKADVMVLCDICHNLCHERLNEKFNYLPLQQKVRHTHEVLHLPHPGSIQTRKSTPQPQDPPRKKKKRRNPQADVKRIIQPLRNKSFGTSPLSRRNRDISITGQMDPGTR